VKALRIYDEEDFSTEDEDEVIYISSSDLSEIISSIEFKSKIFSEILKKGVIGLKHPRFTLYNTINTSELLQLCCLDDEFIPELIPIVKSGIPQQNQDNSQVVVVESAQQSITPLSTHITHREDKQSPAVTDTLLSIIRQPVPGVLLPSNSPSSVITQSSYTSPMKSGQGVSLPLNSLSSIDAHSSYTSSKELGPEVSLPSNSTSSVITQSSYTSPMKSGQGVSLPLNSLSSIDAHSSYTSSRELGPDVSLPFNSPSSSVSSQLLYASSMQPITGVSLPFVSIDSIATGSEPTVSVPPIETIKTAGPGYPSILETSVHSDPTLDPFTTNNRETGVLSGVATSSNCPDFDFDMGCMDICETVTINTTSPESFSTASESVRKVVFKDADTSQMPPPMSINIQNMKIRKPFSISKFSGSTPTASTSNLLPPSPRKTNPFLPPPKKRKHDRSVVKQQNAGLLITSPVTQSDMTPPIFPKVTTVSSTVNVHPSPPHVSSTTNVPSTHKKQKYPVFPSIASFLSAVRNASISDIAFQPDRTPPAPPIPTQDAYFLPPDIQKSLDIQHPSSVVDLTPDDINI
jgi:hypothetical protein